MFIFPLVTTPIFINTVVVFLRIYWFEQKLQHIVKEARSGKIRQRRSLADRDLEQDIALSGSALCRSVQNKKLAIESHTSVSPVSLRSLALPGHAKYSASLLISQVPNSPQLKRSASAPIKLVGLPQIGFLTSRPFDNKSKESFSTKDVIEGISANVSVPIVIRKAATTDAIISDRAAAGSEIHQKLQAFRSRLSNKPLLAPPLGLHKVNTLPYLSYVPTLGRNSTFYGLTQNQREELGGIEYRALKTLAFILICSYFIQKSSHVTCLTVLTLRGSSHRVPYAWVNLSSAVDFKQQKIR